MKVLNILLRLLALLRRRRWLPAVAAGVAVIVFVNWLLPMVWSPSPADRLDIAGTPYYWAGVNYPWKTGQDFGTGGWGHMGVSAPTTYQEIDSDFASMSANGVRIVKWRVFGDGRYGLIFDDEGFVTGVDDKFLPDLDAAVDIAARHDMYLVLVLFASGFWTTDCVTDDVHMGGRAATLLDPAKRRSLVQKGVVPMLRHLGNNSRVLSFEIIAEPDWGVDQLNHEEDGRIKLPLAVVRDFVSQVTKEIHKNTRAMSTVESNRFTNMRYWQRLGLDYYSFSWYDWLEPYDPLVTPAHAARLDRPIVLGEYPLSSQYYELSQVLDATYTSGYAGSFAWSFWSGDNFGNWQEVAPVFATWVKGISEGKSVDTIVLPPTSRPVADLRYPFTYDGFELHPGEQGDILVRLKLDTAFDEPYETHAYLYEIGNPRALQDIVMGPSQAEPGKFSAHLTVNDDTKSYMISLGIFNQNGTLMKWFNNLGRFALVDGQLTTPAPNPQEDLLCKS